MLCLHTFGCYCEPVMQRVNAQECLGMVQARRSGLRAETVELRKLYFQLLELVLQGCSSTCSRARPHAKFYFTVRSTPDTVAVTGVGDTYGKLSRHHASHFGAPGCRAASQVIVKPFHHDFLCLMPTCRKPKFKALNKPLLSSIAYHACKQGNTGLCDAAPNPHLHIKDLCICNCCCY